MNMKMEEIRAIEQTYSVSKNLKLPTDLKPCIAAVLEERHECNVNDLSFKAAVELRRLGKDFADTRRRLKDWNNKNIKKLNPRDIERTVHNVFRKDFQLGCNNALQEICLYSEKSLCSFYKQILKNYPKSNFNRWFIKLEWPKYLGNVAKLMYVLVIPELETRRGLKPGSRLFANYNEMRKVGHFSQASIKPSLQELEKAGLIYLKIGLRHRHYNTATEIQRIIPLPEHCTKLVKVNIKN